MNSGTPEIRIEINGETRVIANQEPLSALIEALGLAAQMTLVEHNGKALFRADWESIRLSEGDRLEILRVAAGG